MGETYIRVRVRASPRDESFIELSLLVDTGSTYSWIPKYLLEKLGVEPAREARFKTIQGDIVKRTIGHVFVEFEGEIAPTTVVFAEKTDSPVFGLHGLESLGLEVDPSTRQIRKSEALLAT